MSASVLCFSVTPGGEVFFLLGKQAAPRNGHYTRAANTWCDFGGHEAARDGADQATTAAREFYEESLCCINIDGEPCGASLGERVSSLAHSLRSGNYVAAIAVPVGSHSPPHVCYLKHIPWDAAAPRTFDQMRAAATLIREESKALTWMARRRPEGLRMQFFEQWLYRLAPSRAARVTSLHWVGAGAITATFQERTHATTTMTVELPDRFAAADVENYRTYIRRTDKMHALWERLTPHQKTHPAIKCTWWRGRVIRMTVQRYFMEMQRITWWGLPVLHDLVRAMGCSRGSVIRGCFMPTIRIALDYLAARHGTHAGMLNPVPIPVKERKCVYNHLLCGGGAPDPETKTDAEAAPKQATPS